MHQVISKFRLALILIVAHLYLIMACEKNPTESEQKQVPSLPPVSSMQIDLSLFVGKSLAKNNNFSQYHFTTAVVTATIVNTWVVISLAAPVYIFGRALHEKPELQSDGKFHWMYTAIPYSVDLAGWIDVPNKQSVWEMYVTQGQNFDHFMWYNGHCNLDATAGDWTFYDETKPDSSINKVRIDWINNSELDRVLTFTNVLPGGQYENDQLKYTVDGNNRSIEFYDASEGTTVTIFWDAVTTAGYIQAPNYNNGEKAYWDENHNDIP